MKKKSVARLKRKLWSIFSEYIRLRDCLMTTGTLTRGKCICCEAELPFKDLQAGHFIAGRGNAILFDEECVHSQCRVCNIIKGGNILVYRRKIIDLYGKGYDEILEKRAIPTRKFTVEELESLISEYQGKIKLLEEK